MMVGAMAKFRAKVSTNLSPQCPQGSLLALVDSDAAGLDDPQFAINRLCSEQRSKLGYSAGRRQS
jgi:hypothetical protein